MSIKKKISIVKKTSFLKPPMGKLPIFWIVLWQNFAKKNT
jgi:hypothetical protein